jgi:hypothetical protein
MEPIRGFTFCFVARNYVNFPVVRCLQSGRRGVVRILTCILALALAGTARADKVFINDRWPIRGPNGVALSPPHVEPTNECSKSVYVDSFVPKATITVFLNGTTIIGGPITPEFGFADVSLTQQLHTGDKITATQTVNGVTSQPSAPMIVGKMPTTLPAPTIDANIYACGQIVPVHNLIPGVTVEVRDLTTGGVVGSGATPNLWGSDWAPVVTSPLVSGHQITAKQSACTGVESPDGAAMPVKSDPVPLKAPTLDPPIVGNDAITAHGLFTGSLLKVFQPALIGSELTTAESNWMHVAPPIKAAPGVTAEQDLCKQSPRSSPQNPMNKIPPPVLVGPICPDQPDAIVRNTTINATLVLLKNGVVTGYGGAAPGDVPLDIAPPASFAQNDTVQVVEYIGNIFVMSNTVSVGCTSATTYHNDSQRTGWNAAENTLTPTNVTPATFGLITNVLLDNQVDTQPLVVTDQIIEGEGVHTVVYVATEGNTVYAIDSWSGGILKSVNLGAPVPTPLGCGNNGPQVGINGTPTIDARTQTIYVVVYTLMGGTPTYRLHALDLSTLLDKPGSPITIEASHALATPTPTPTPTPFRATVQRQRPALLQANGNVYAAFGSFCDFRPNESRGWLLGWNANTLGALAANELTDTLPTAPTPFFLSSIWMSGYGVAADPGGDLFFVTGNSDPGGDTYTGTTNIQESVVKMEADLSAVADLFTPSNVFPLDQVDEDYGSGGVMVLPDQPGPIPHLAVAAGKDGRLFILNRDTGKMGEHHSTDIPKHVTVGNCWCGPSYYKGSDGVGRVVSSGGFQVKSWKVNTALSPALTHEASSPSLAKWSQDGGFFTSISSNGTKPKTAIIWAVGRPVGNGNHVTLYAFNATASGSTLPQLWTGLAGTWPNTGGNANIVPTVANGRVYVGSYRQLSIFGLISTKQAQQAPPPRRVEMFQPAPPPLIEKPPGATFWGTIKRVDGARIAIALRTGQLLQVDLSEAMKTGTTITPNVNINVAVNGTLNADGVLEARTMWRAKGPAIWGADSRE